jgi:hypothetical protein
MSEGIEVRSIAEGFDFDAQESCLCCMLHTVHLSALEVNELIAQDQKFHS